VLGLVLGLGVTAACASGNASRPAPVLALKSRDPVIVSGSHFTAHAAVRLLVVARVLQSRAVRTNARGAFTATFSAVIDRCSGWSVTASQRGRAPVVIRGARPECAPASTP